MITIEGKARKAEVLVQNESDLEQYAKAQIQRICDNEIINSSRITVMPDVHPGKVGPIGLTMMLGYDNLHPLIMPALIGPDIGCGVSILKFEGFRKGEMDKLDTVIRENIPVGARRRSKDKRTYFTPFKYKFNGCNFSTDNLNENVGTLGGGNHFIEIDQDPDNGDTYITVHTGSRNIGATIYENYMSEMQKYYKLKDMDVPYEDTILFGPVASMYFHDVIECTKFAEDNREEIIMTICNKMKWKCTRKEIISCPHNYIDGNNGILRKGAIAAYPKTPVVIPVNSRDGVILGKGVGSDKWHMSAPHGSGRIIKRSEVANEHTVSEYRKVMKDAGVYSPTISKGSLEEAPFAYRGLDYLLNSGLEETVKIEKILKPIYNYKSED